MKKSDKSGHETVVEMKVFISRGGFYTQNQTDSQNLSSLGDLKPQKPAFSLFFFSTFKLELCRLSNHQLHMFFMIGPVKLS